LGVWNNSFASTLQYKNPPRRDVAMLPSPGGPGGPGGPGSGPPPTGGWLVLAFLTDNPGAWLMHCHIVGTSNPHYLEDVEKRRFVDQANILNRLGTSAKVSQFSFWSAKVRLLA
jgi:hypothetical protein